MDEIYAYNEYLRQKYERTHDIRMCPLHLKSILRMRTSVNRKHLLMNSFWEHRCRTTD